MQIFVDADACPVVDIVETIAEKYNISTTLLCDTNHILYSDYSEVIVVSAGADAVENAVKQVLKDKYRTIDIMPQEAERAGEVTQVGTSKMGDLICERIQK